MLRILKKKNESKRYEMFQYFPKLKIDKGIIEYGVLQIQVYNTNT